MQHVEASQAISQLPCMPRLDCSKRPVARDAGCADPLKAACCARQHRQHHLLASSAQGVQVQAPVLYVLLGGDDHLVLLKSCSLVLVLCHGCTTCSQCAGARLPRLSSLAVLDYQFTLLRRSHRCRAFCLGPTRCANGDACVISNHEALCVGCVACDARLYVLQWQHAIAGGAL
jgi:hypothetical protein